MKRIALVFLACSVPALMLLNAWQAFRFQAELDYVRELESQQRDLIEENKRALIGVEILSSPSRIEEVVGVMDEIGKRGDTPRLIIRVSEPDAGN